MIGDRPRAIRSRRIVTPEGVLDGAVFIEDGVIHEVLPAKDLEASAPILDVGDLVLMPGLVDTHVHINEPGRTDWEGFETATRAAAAGGVTTLIDMPLNSLPVTTTVEALSVKMASAAGKLHVDCGFHGGLVPDNASDILPLVEAGVLGIKAFMVDSGIPEFPAVGLEELDSALQILAPFQIPLLAHAEIEGRAPKPSNARSYPNYAASRPQAWEEQAVALLIDVCRKHHAPVHIVHLAASRCLPAIRAARHEGLPLSIETCPHYLFFTQDQVPDGDTLFKCAPPIRDQENRDRLWSALRKGDIDFVVSDHSPAPPELKNLSEGDFLSAWGGISSLQLGLSIIWTLLRREDPEGDRFEEDLGVISHWMCSGPSQLVGLDSDRGAIRVGKRADLIVWDPETKRTVEPSQLHTKHAITPYQGALLSGVVLRTFLAGRCVYQDGQFLDHPAGQCVLRDAEKPIR